LSELSGSGACYLVPYPRQPLRPGEGARVSPSVGDLMIKTTRSFMIGSGIAVFFVFFRSDLAAWFWLDRPTKNTGQTGGEMRSPGRNHNEPSICGRSPSDRQGHERSGRAGRQRPDGLCPCASGRRPPVSFFFNTAAMIDPWPAIPIEGCQKQISFLPPKSDLIAPCLTWIA
jgi:hypothetical protein